MSALFKLPVAYKEIAISCQRNSLENVIVPANFLSDQAGHQLADEKEENEFDQVCQFHCCLGMAFVESGNLTESEDSWLINLPSQILNGVLGFQAVISSVHPWDCSLGIDRQLPSCSRGTCLPLRIDPNICTFLPSTHLPSVIRDMSLFLKTFQNGLELVLFRFS